MNINNIVIGATVHDEYNDEIESKVFNSIEEIKNYYDDDPSNIAEIDKLTKAIEECKDYELTAEHYLDINHVVDRRDVDDFDNKISQLLVRFDVEEVR